MKTITKQRLRLALGLLLVSAVVVVAQQGTVIIRNRNSNVQATVTSNNALQVTPIDSNGSAYAAVTDPCDGILPTNVAISLTSDTVVIPASSAKKNYICNITIVAAAAEVVSITEGTGSVCGTSETAIMGSTTDANGMSFAANGGFSNTRTIAGTGTNVDTCLNVSGSNRVSGFLDYVQQ